MTQKKPPQKKLIISPQEIDTRVKTLGETISLDYQKLLNPGEDLLVVGVLNGAFIFMADLIRTITVPLEIDFIRLSSYQDKTYSSTQVVMLKNMEIEVKNRHVLVVEDIADCGLTLAWLMDFLSKREPASIKTVVAVNKKSRREVNLTLDYVGFTLEDGFIVGYGLDYAKKYRQYAGIYHLDV
jgi:hypoxanthine phosphoribosyltransferase